MQLVKVCNNKLNAAEESIAKIVKENGDIVDFNIDE
jgi:exodeoxyribonuclease VII small subunit